MMISIERLFTLSVPGSPGFEPIAGKGIFSENDALGVIAQAQGFAPLGVRVLEGTIADIASSRAILRRKVARVLIAKGEPKELAHAMARIVVHEVCGTRICQRCKGRGETRAKGKIFVCRGCGGIGRIIHTDAMLAHVMSKMSGHDISPKTWAARYRDMYRTLITELLHATSDAERECKRILRIEMLRMGMWLESAPPIESRARRVPAGMLAAVDDSSAETETEEERDAFESMAGRCCAHQYTVSDG